MTKTARYNRSRLIVAIEKKRCAMNDLPLGHAAMSAVEDLDRRYRTATEGPGGAATASAFERMARQAMLGGTGSALEEAARRAARQQDELSAVADAINRREEARRRDFDALSSGVFENLRYTDQLFEAVSVRY